MKGISCQELLSYIPDKLLTRLEEKTKVNWQVKKLTGKTMFKLFVFTLLGTGRASLRVMEDIYNSTQFKIFCEGGNQKIKHSGIGERMGHIKSDFFQQIFEFLIQEFDSLLQKQKFDGKWNIAKFDSTLVSISSNLIHFGIEGFGKNKGDKKQMKYTIGVKNMLPHEAILFTQQELASEEIALKKAILRSIPENDTIVIFDRGLQRRKTFADFTNKNILFVTRLKDRVRYKKVKTHKEVQGRKSKTLKLKQDIIVKLIDETEKFMEQEFRLIIATSLETGEELKFLTNITDINAREITDIYKERWYIEMFFRFLKQELNFKHLISRTHNGVKVMLYMTMIVALLILVYKIKNKTEGYKRTKLRFVLELEMEIIKDIVIACNGDISLFNSLKKPHPI